MWAMRSRYNANNFGATRATPWISTIVSVTCTNSRSPWAFTMLVVAIA
jgi:hypothetical protein